MVTVDAPKGKNREVVIFDAKEFVANTREELAVKNSVENTVGLGIEPNEVNATEDCVEKGRELNCVEDSTEGRRELFAIEATEGGIKLRELVTVEETLGSGRGLAMVVTTEGIV